MGIGLTGNISARKTPRQARAIATRAAIVEAAARIISEGGLGAFNTNAVSACAGVSVGSLYQYFPNKDAIMAALIARQQQFLTDQIEASLETTAHLEFEAAMRHLVRLAMHLHREDALLATAIDHEEARLPVQAIVLVALERSGALVSALLAKLRPDLSAEVVARAARTLPNLVRAVVDAWANLDPPQIDVAEEEAVKAVIGYLG